jgi:hypothetical protein
MKTRVRDLEGGGQEIIRLISPDELDESSKDDHLFYEKSVVWLEDITPLKFVRVRTIHTAKSRRGPLYLGGDGRVVGYSKLLPNAPIDSETGGYVRRLFYLRAVDVADEDAEVPAGAVDPRSILPGVEGHTLVDHPNGQEVA